MKNELLIRRAHQSDAEELSQMICENAKTTLAPHYTEAQWSNFVTHYSPEVVQTMIDEQIVFCGELKGEIVGSIALDNDFVIGFYTRLSNLQQGIGKALMKHLEAFAFERKLTKIQLTASPAGLDFYLRHGWTKVKDVVIDYYGVGFEETLMEKKLN